jgi:hypothetical protein
MCVSAGAVLFARGGLRGPVLWEAARLLELAGSAFPGPLRGSLDANANRTEIIHGRRTMGMMKVDPKLTKAQIKRYDQWMDSECVPICDALNSLPGIETFESCCGHRKNPFFVAFTAATVESLRPILVSINDERAWAVRAAWASGGGAIYFTLDGPVGAFRIANLIAGMIKNEFPEE